MPFKMLDEMRWMLAERRAVRAYETSPDKSFSFGPVKLGIADDNRWASHKGVFVFQFGAYSDTHVLAYGCLEGALEDAAAWLKDNAPGHLCEPDYEQALLDSGYVNTSIEQLEDDAQESIRVSAETDLTYTESGWLLSHEWTCTEIGTPEELIAYVKRQS